MKQWLKWILPALVAAFALLQLTNPARINPPVAPGRDFVAANAPPAALAALLRAACYDCHSDETRWPWYSRVAPVSWLVTGDVRHGREHLNLSEWPYDHPDRAARRLENMSEEIDNGEMPLRKYTLIHADARLTAAQRGALRDWLDQAAEKLKSSAPGK